MTKSGASAKKIMSAAAAIVEAHTAVADAIKSNTPVATPATPFVSHAANTEHQTQNFDGLPTGTAACIAFWTEYIDATFQYLMQLPNAKDFKGSCIIQLDFMIKNTHKAWRYVLECTTLAPSRTHQKLTP